MLIDVYDGVHCETVGAMGGREPEGERQRSGSFEKTVATVLGAVIAIGGVIAAVSNLDTAALGIFVSLLGFGVLIYAQTVMGRSR